MGVNHVIIVLTVPLNQSKEKSKQRNKSIKTKNRISMKLPSMENVKSESRKKLKKLLITLCVNFK